MDLSGGSAQGTAGAKLRTVAVVLDVNGPEPTSTDSSHAAVQLHHTSRRCIAQHFPRMNDDRRTFLPFAAEAR